MSGTRVEIIEAEDINNRTDRLERHPGLLLKELIGPDAKISSAGPIIGVYEATVQSGDDYWPRENEDDVERLAYVQQGKGHLTVDDDKYNLRSGSLARIRQGEEKEAHVRNTGEDPLKLLLIIFKNSSGTG